MIYGVHFLQSTSWVPAFAGMTEQEYRLLFSQNENGRDKPGHHDEAATKISARYISPFRNGLLTRSWPKVEPGPWPLMKPTSSPSGISLSVIELIKVR